MRARTPLSSRFSAPTARADHEVAPGGDGYREETPKQRGRVGVRVRSGENARLLLEIDVLRVGRAFPRIVPFGIFT
jgi:hypothetical protein